MYVISDNIALLSKLKSCAMFPLIPLSVARSHVHGRVIPESLTKVLVTSLFGVYSEIEVFQMRLNRVSVLYRWHRKMSRACPGYMYLYPPLFLCAENGVKYQYNTVFTLSLVIHVSCIQETWLPWYTFFIPDYTVLQQGYSGNVRRDGRAIFLD